MIKEELTGMDRDIIKTKGEENFVGTQMSIIKSAPRDGQRGKRSPFKYPRRCSGPRPGDRGLHDPANADFVITGTGPILSTPSTLSMR